MPKVELISREESFEVASGESTFTIRRLPDDVVREIQQRHAESSRAKRERPTLDVSLSLAEAESTEANKDILDYIVRDWRGVLGPDGQDAPCTRENKWALPSGVRLQILRAAQGINRGGDLIPELKHVAACPPKSGPPDPQNPGA